jgi:hypothetical protein
MSKRFEQKIDRALGEIETLLTTTGPADLLQVFQELDIKKGSSRSGIAWYALLKGVENGRLFKEPYPAHAELTEEPAHGRFLYGVPQLAEVELIPVAVASGHFSQFE